MHQNDRSIKGIHMNLDPTELERNARRMRAEAVSCWLADLPAVLRGAGRSFADFVRAFRAFPGIRA